MVIVEDLLLPVRFHLEDIEWPVYVKLTNGKVFGCDLIVSAIGVTPNVEICTRSADVRQSPIDAP